MFGASILWLSLVLAGVPDIPHVATAQPLSATIWAAPSAMQGTGPLRIAPPIRHGAARPVRKRYAVTVPLGPLRDTPLPAIEGPEDRRLPLVVIDAGHGGHDPGAIHGATGTREKDVVVALARAIRDALVASGRVRVALTRSDDRFLVLEERYAIAQRMKADLLVSIHADAATHPDARGASIYTLSEVASDREAARLAARENRANVVGGVDLTRQSDAVSSILIDLTQRETMTTAADFARVLRREGAATLNFRDPPVRFASFIVLKAPDVPSILLETGFVSNDDDVAFLTSPAGRTAIAGAVRRAIEVHFARRLSSNAGSTGTPR